jgi:uncharacterized phage protein gp47/JayE
MASPPNPTTNVPAPTFGPQGFQAPSEQAILSGTLADINAAFGGNLNVANLFSPQAQLASSMAAIIGNSNDTFVFYTTQTDPAFATGRMQDAIGRIYGMTRNPPVATSVNCLCSGIPGTPIPVGAQALDTLSNLVYNCTLAGIIPPSGQITLPFACSVTGPISCLPNFVNQIFRAIPGWASVTNPQAGTTGRDQESRAQFEQRRQASVQANATGINGAIRGAVLGITGVLDCYVIDNPTNGTVTLGTGTVLSAYSLYVAVSGGNPGAVAAAIWGNKPPGCSYTGNTTVTVYDNNSGYSPPLPSYQVTFEIVNNLIIYFNVKIVAGPTVPSNAGALVQQALFTAFDGETGAVVPGIGAVLTGSQFLSAITGLGSWAQVVSIQMGSIHNDPSGLTVFNGSISNGLLTVTSVVSGTLSPGMALTDGTIGNLSAAGFFIIDQASGTPGGIGTYDITALPSLVVGTEQMTGIQTNNNAINVGIDEIPTYALPNGFLSFLDL